MMKAAQNKSDETVDDIMNQDANFIKTQEGYPIFLKHSNDPLSKVKFSSFSAEIGVLDFYESLTILPKVCSSLQILFQDLLQHTPPQSNLHAIHLQTVFYQKCWVEYKKCKAYTGGEEDLIEYRGS